MANLVITSNTNTIKVVFNDTPFQSNIDDFLYSKGTWRKDEISSIKLNSSRVIVSTKNGIVWQVSDVETDGAFIVDSIDAASPSDLSDLYDKLVALIA